MYLILDSTSKLKISKTYGFHDADLLDFNFKIEYLLVFTGAFYTDRNKSADVRVEPYEVPKRVSRRKQRVVFLSLEYNTFTLFEHNYFTRFVHPRTIKIMVFHCL